MRSLLRCGLFLFPFLSACIAAGPESEEQEDLDTDEYGVKSCPDGTTVKGVDVSYFQGSISWSEVKSSGVKFGIARVADGNNFVDPRFAQNWQRMKSAGVIRGAYQFFRPDQTAASQAEVFLDELEAAGGLESGDLPPTLDIEVTEGVSKSTIISRANAWLSKVRDATGRNPMIYTSPGFWSQLGTPSGFSDNPLWVAHWDVSCPSLASSWNKWSFWQKSDSGSVSGISGQVDIDFFNGSLEDLRKFADPRRGGAPVVSSWAAGRLDVFVRGENDHLKHRWYDGSWSSWEDLGGKLTSDPAAVSWADGRIDVFARGASKDLIHRWYIKGQGWSGWQHLGGTLASTPTVSSWASGRLDVFARGTGDGLLHKWFKSGNGWSNWQSLGGNLASRPTAVSWGEGRIDVFARGEGDDIVHRSYESDEGWSDWGHLDGAFSSAPTVSSWGVGRLDVFARGEGNHLVHNWFTPEAGWHTFKPLGGTLRSSPGAVSWASGRIDVFARGDDDRLEHRIYKTGEGWLDWRSNGEMP